MFRFSPDLRVATFLFAIVLQTAKATPGGESTTTSLSAPPFVVYGQQVTLTAQVSVVIDDSLGGLSVPTVPTGSVQFNGVPGGSEPVTLDGSGQAQLVVNNLQVADSPYTFTATYNPSGPTFLSSTSGQSLITVTAASTFIQVTTSQTPSASGQSVTFTATVSAEAPSSAIPGGVVEFYINLGGFGPPVPVNSNGQATLTISSLAVGLNLVSAQFGEVGGNFLASAAPNIDQVVNLNNSNLYWTDRNTGDRVVWAMNGTSFSSGVQFTTLGSNWEIDGTGDFSLNGQTDILWTNTTTGERVIWMMNGNSFLQSYSLGTVPTNWIISGVADFNNDGSPDILFRNTTTGEGLIWLMSGTTHTTDESIGIIPANLRISAVGNNGGGGVADIVMTNAETGERTVWGVLGSQLVESNTLGTVAANWVLFQSGEEPVEPAKNDFNGDGNPDLLFENTTTGDLYVWLMNRTSLSSSAFIGNVPTQWQVVGTGDFSADGSPDILWQNSSTGQVVIWVMNGTNYVSTVPVAVAPAGWSVSGVADFNGDGYPDILWTNTTTGQRLIWLMNGTTYGSSV